MIKINMCLSILLLLLTQLIVGCGARRGPFMELGVGMGAVVADEEWTASKYSDGDLWTWSGQELIEQTHHDAIAATGSPAGNLKIGWGFTEQLLVSGTVLPSKFSTLGIGITYFQKETAPSLFFDITLPVSRYRQNFSNQFSTNVVGRGFNGGVGYEFKKNWTVRGNFGFGTHDVNTSDAGAEQFLVLLGIFPGYTEYEGKTTGFSLGFTVNYIWY